MGFFFFFWGGGGPYQHAVAELRPAAGGGDLRHSAGHPGHHLGHFRRENHRRPYAANSTIEADRM